MRKLLIVCLLAGFSIPCSAFAQGLDSDNSFGDSVPLHMHGVAIPHEYVTMSTTVPGMLSELRVQEGDVVTAGQILAVIDDRVAKASAEVARIEAESMAVINQTKVDMAVAESRMKRTADVVRRGAGSSFELEDVKAELTQARAAFASAKEVQAQAAEQLKLAKAQLEQHYVRAMFDGKIARIHGRVGESLAPQDKLITVCNVGTLEVELFVPADLYRGLKQGDEYQLQAAAPLNQTVTGRLQAVSPMIDTTMNAVRCLFIISNGDHVLPGGFGVSLHNSELRKLAKAIDQHDAAAVTTVSHVSK